MGSVFIYACGVTTICLLNCYYLLEQERPLKIHLCQTGGFHHVEGDSFDNTTDFDRHLLICCQLLSSFNVRSN